jgi:hypothetical protein
VLPPLLLLRDLFDAPRLDRPRLRRMTMVHAPFWMLLVCYLGLRFSLFGMLGRPNTPTSISEVIHNEYLGLLSLWLSPFGTLGRIALLLLTPALLLTPFLTKQARNQTFTRNLIFFAVMWPLLSTAVLFGARAPRHLYLASAGLAIAFGLAGSQLLTSKFPVAAAGLVIVGLLLAVLGVGLIAGIRLYARNGQLSRALAQEVEVAIERATADRLPLIVIIPEFPERRVIFWDYFYPVALNPPFRKAAPAVAILPSFASCHCEPAAWKRQNAAALALLNSDRASAIYAVLWDTRKSAFATRIFSPSEFRQAGYGATDGPLLRPRRQGMPAPQFP